MLLNCFNVLVTLVILGCADSTESCVKDCTCDMLLGLKTLSCPRRNLDTFPNGIDNGTQFLRLEGNNIRDIPGNLSRLLPELQRLDMSDNKVALLRSRIFAGLKNLKDVNLMNNEISAIEDNIFEGSETERMNLRLRGNKVKSIHSKAFRGLYANSKIDLRDNFLRSLHPDTLHGVRILTLDLSYNTINGLPERLFENQDQLYFLELRENNISSLDDQVFFDLSSLETLDLSSNKLDDLPIDLFQNNKLLATINLDSNKFTAPPLLNLPSKIDLTLKNNPVLCDCELKRLLSNSSYKVVVTDFDRVVCLNRSETVREMLPKIDCRTTTPIPPTTTAMKTTTVAPTSRYMNTSLHTTSGNESSTRTTYTWKFQNVTSTKNASYLNTTKITTVKSVINVTSFTETFTKPLTKHFVYFSTTPFTNVKVKRGITQLKALILGMVAIVIVVMVGIFCYVQARDKIIELYDSARRKLGRLCKFKSSYLVNEGLLEDDVWVWKPGPGSKMNRSFEV